jgi:hypothetical protein
MSNTVAPGQSSCGGAVELRHTYNMRTARDRRHCYGVTEGSAEWHGAKQHRIFCIESNAASHVSGMPGDCLLVVQDQFRSVGGSEVVKVRHGAPPVAADAVFQAIRATDSDRNASLCQIIDRLIRAIEGVRREEREKKVAHVKMKDRPDVFASRKHFQSDTQRRL